MRKSIVLLSSLFLFSACFPIAIAPNLENGKVIRARKFKRKLPNRHTYVFTDHKDANEFYSYINTKYSRNHKLVTTNVPVTIASNTYYLSFFEADKSSKTINLVPLLIDARRSSNGNEPILENHYSSRKDVWYILLQITAEDFSDALDPEYARYAEVFQFATKMREEYNRTFNYRQTILQASKN